MDITENIVDKPAASTVDKKKAAAKKKRKRIIKTVISLVVVLAILGGIAFLLYKLFHKEDTEKQLWTDFVYTGSIQTSVTGSGVTQAKNSSSIVLTAGGMVSEVFVSEGDWVNEGDPLYVIDSSEAQAAITAAEEGVKRAQEQVQSANEYAAARQKDVDEYLKQISEINDSKKHLLVTAPFDGKLLKVADYAVGGYIGPSAKIATLVDDSQLILPLYFSYAYKDMISVGQSATVSVSSAMAQLTGKVSDIAYVEYVSPEGGVFFEVDILIDNPGTFTNETTGTAELTASDGTPIYPYDMAVMKYVHQTDIVTDPSLLGGKIQEFNLRSYARVSKGQTLVKISDEEYKAKADNLQLMLKSAQTSLNDAYKAINEAQKGVETAKENVVKAEEKLQDFNAVAPLSGTVITCAIEPGMEVASGTMVISIADTSTMYINAQIDGLNVTYVKPGMFCEVTQWGRDGQQTYYGTVDSVSLEGKYENGVSYFPAVISVDNPDGSMMNGMYVDYSMAASQSENCLLVPVQAVKYTALGTCLFVRTDYRPDNAYEADELGIEIPEGFYAVPVEVGLSDSQNAEILSGVEDGTEVFVQYMTNSGDSYSGMGMDF